MIVGNNRLREIYEMYDDFDLKISELLEGLKYSPECVFDDESTIDLLDKDEHFFITCCCSALMIWWFKRTNRDLVPKWIFDDRLILDKSAIFGFMYEDKGLDFVKLRIVSPLEFIWKNVYFEEYSLTRM